MTGGLAGRYVAKSEPTTALLRYDAACRALAEAKGIDEVKDVRDKAEALRLYGRQAKNKTLEIDAAEIRFRAERRIGQIEIEMHASGEMHSGGRPTKTGSKNEPVFQKTLANLGIDKRLSSRAQKIAAVPEDKFEAMVATWRDRVGQENERVTTALIKEGEKAERRSVNQEIVEGGGTVEDLLALAATGYRAGTISADPAWSYETWSDRGEDRSAKQHYSTETLEEIVSRPVAPLAAPDSLLHLWCPSSMLEQGLQVIAAWGFTFKKVGFIWTKTVDDGTARKMGNGHWTRDEAELCLLATKGSPKRLDAGVRQTLDAPLGEHSEKPDEFYNRMLRLATGPYLELYGRKERPFWTVWGNQVRWQAPPPRTKDGEAFDPETGEILSTEGEANGTDDRQYIGRADEEQHAAPSVSSSDGRGEGADAGSERQGPGTADSDRGSADAAGAGEPAGSEWPDDRDVRSGTPHSNGADGGSCDVGGETHHEVAEIATAPAGETPVGAAGGDRAAPIQSDDDYVGDIPAFLRRA